MSEPTGHQGDSTGDVSPRGAPLQKRFPSDQKNDHLLKRSPTFVCEVFKTSG